jgi:arylsulfatase A-like enzyme
LDFSLEDIIKKFRLSLSVEVFNNKMKQFLQLLFLVTCLVACPGLMASSSQNDRPWSVLLITVDNLRPDRMSLYGYERDTTPYLSKFAAESAVFDSAFSTSAWTAPGMVSIFTGYYPPVHAQHGRFSFYDEKMTAAFRILAEQGYEIFGQGINGPSHQGFGFQKHLGPRSKRQLEDFIEQRIENKTPFFAWAHIKDVHLPYAPSEKNANRFGATSHNSKAIEAVKKHRIILRHPERVEIEFNHAGKVEFSEEDIPIVQALYDGEVADVDERLRLNLERMRETGLLDHTIVIISADHGEELFDHGWLGHASTGYDAKLYDPLIRIPLIIRLPDQSLTGRYSTLVQGVDFMPTIFDILDVSAAGMRPQMQGHSFLPILKGKKEKIRDYAFNQTSLKGWTTPKDEMTQRIVSVRSTSKKLIQIPNGEGVRIEAYDLLQDPDELTDIYSTRAEEFEDLEKALQDWIIDNRSRAAELVQGAAEKRIENIANAVLGDGGMGEAVSNWSSIQTMEATWGLEPDTFYLHEPYATSWQQIQRTAAHMVGRAMICKSKGGVLRLKNSKQSQDIESWQCEL